MKNGKRQKAFVRKHLLKLLSEKKCTWADILACLDEHKQELEDQGLQMPDEEYVKNYVGALVASGEIDIEGEGDNMLYALGEYSQQGLQMQLDKLQKENAALGQRNQQLLQDLEKAGSVYDTYDDLMNTLQGMAEEAEANKETIDVVLGQLEELAPLEDECRKGLPDNASINHVILHVISIRAQATRLQHLNTIWKSLRPKEGDISSGALENVVKMVRSKWSTFCIVLTAIMCSSISTYVVSQNQPSVSVGSFSAELQAKLEKDRQRNLKSKKEKQP